MTIHIPATRFTYRLTLCAGRWFAALIACVDEPWMRPGSGSVAYLRIGGASFIRLYRSAFFGGQVLQDARVAS